MNNYGKIVDGELQYPPSEVLENGARIIGFTEAFLLARGYKPITDSGYPDDGNSYSLSYEETDTAITVIYTAIALLADDLLTLKNRKQLENESALSGFLAANPLLWTDGEYYAVDEESQNEMLNTKAAYDLKQSLGETDWVITWSSVYGSSRDFTVEEFTNLLSAVVDFVHPFKVLENTYKARIYEAESKEELDSIEFVYVI